MSKFDSWDNPLWGFIVGVTLIIHASWVVFLTVMSVLPKHDWSVAAMSGGYSVIIYWLAFMFVRQSFRLLKGN